MSRAIAGADDRAQGGPPTYDQAAVSRVATRVQIRDVELVGAHYERADDGVEAATLPADVGPQYGIDVARGEIDQADRFVCLLTFGTLWDVEDPPYSIVGRFRITYTIREQAGLQPGDLDQFAHWNAMFNAWPYWREFVSNVVDRGRLPRHTVPVMGIPTHGTTDLSGLP